MRNTPQEQVKYHKLLNELEESLFESLRIIRHADIGDNPEVYSKRVEATEYLKKLQQQRWHLNNSYGFSPADHSSAEMIKAIQIFRENIKSKFQTVVC